MKRHIFLSIATLLCTMGVAVSAAAQGRAVNIRYVMTEKDGGKYSNKGLSWDDAKNNIQDAINDLVGQGLTGEVWVAKGTYTPTESTEASGGSTLYMSFKVPAGITVRGGFRGLDTDNNYPGETTADERAMRTDTQKDGDKTYTNETILSGDLAQSARFEWNAKKNYWDASFYGNCYHVVWFATNGFDSNGRANALNTSIKGEAIVEGFTIKNGNARNTSITGRTHNAYGGGVYMVAGSRLENCCIMQCEASRDGGGIYMDGGGVVRHCYVTNCQSLGVSVDNGYGGGVCLDANKSVATGIWGMYRSVVNGCVARMGGGVAIKSEHTAAPDGTDLRYKTFLSACAIYNNTATTEGGGVYTLAGGALSNITITRNKCNGTGIITNGITTGRAGGLYCRDHAVVLNSVLWGNACKANEDIQFATSQSSSATSKRVKMQYCAVANSNQTDWSTTAKEGIFQVSNYNSKAAMEAAGGTASETDRFVNFVYPTDSAGYFKKPSPDPDVNIVEAGLCHYYNWHPGANSTLANAGIVSNDLNIDGDLPFRTTPLDVVGNAFNSRSTLGGYTRIFTDMSPCYADLYGADGKPGTDGKMEWHFFVDPNFNTHQDGVRHGISWESPARFLGNVLETIKKYRERYVAGAFDPENYDPMRDISTVQFAPEEMVYVHVKEGTVNNTNSYTNDRVRNATLSLSSYTTVLGGYPKELTYDNLSQTIGGTVYSRNPVWHPTFVNANITDNYAANAAHLFTINGSETTPVTNVTIDGFNIRNANARSTMYGNTLLNGGAITINNAENVSILNSFVAGCTAERGSALFINNGKNVEVENCIFHNNEAKLTDGSALSGVIYISSSVNDDCQTTFKHCDVLNNVGYAYWLTGDKAKVRWENSIMFANMKTARPAAYYTDDDDAATVSAFKADLLPVTPANISYENPNITVHNCLYDSATVVNGIPSILSCKLNTVNYPRFINGVRNVGVSPGGDETFYGRSTSFQPHNNNPMVNRATYDDTKDPLAESGAWGYDLTTVTPRTYGGRPDIGAIENHEAIDEEENAYHGGQPGYGAVVYVKTPEDGGDDNNSGMSWHEPLATIQKAIEMANVEGGEVYDGDAVVTTQTTYRKGAELTSAAAGAGAEWVQITSDRDPNAIITLIGNTIGWTTSTTANLPSMLFKFVAKDYRDGRNGDYYILTYGTDGTDGHYITTAIANNTSMTVTNAGDGNANYSKRQLFTLSLSGYNNNKGFNIRNTTSTANADRQYLNHYGSNKVAGWDYKDDIGSSWTITNAVIETTTTTTGTLLADTNNRQVWVAKGTYTSKSDDSNHALNAFTDPEGSGKGRCHNQKFSIMLREAVNVYGGFNNTGSPGLEDRNPKLYETIIQPGDPLEDVSESDKAYFQSRGIDGTYPLEYRANSETCGSYGRVVVQEKDFQLETVLDGFTITNGFLNTTSQVNIYGKLYDIMKNSDNKVGLTGGAGVYLMNNGVIENCIIKGNMTYSSPEGANADPVTAENTNNTYLGYKDPDNGGFHTVAAGVYNKGGKVINSEICYNMILFELMHESESYSEEGALKRSQAAWLYGAGLFQESGTVYNTIIHNNKQKITNFKVREGYESSGYGGYDDPYSDEGKTHNEYWPRTFNTSAIGETKSSHQSAAGAGVFLVSGEFYNNTVVNNTYRLWPQYVKCETMIGIGGVYAFDGATIYNCIITKNEPATLKDAGLEHPHSTGKFLRDGMTSASYFNYPIICFSTASGSNYTPAPENITVRYSAVDYRSAEEIWPSTTLPIRISNMCLKNDLTSATNSAMYFFNAKNSYGYAAVNAECNCAGTPSYANGSGTNWYGLRDSNTDYTGLINYSGSNQYKLTSASPAMNNGTNNIPGTILPDYDAEYTTRIKDCTVDMGAYEYSDSYEITPKTILKDDNTVDYDKPATFYVTPEGRGLASGHDPANAACAAKLQRVLDAAGRYKFIHPEQQVIVKVAQYKGSSTFTYYATRTADVTESNSDVRTYSIIVPKGVEVWGGYSDEFTDENDNGFYKNTVVDGKVTKTEEQRDITGNPTYFDSYYYNADLASGINTYHVVTFSDKVYDGEGVPYLSSEGDKVISGEDSDPNARALGDEYLKMGDKYEKGEQVYGQVKDRSVVDGIYITSGQADLQSIASGTNRVNVNRYGGAAIVTDFAHVRNCIIRGNSGVYGGALALMGNALVSGCLIERNEADYGGAIYVFGEGTILSTGDTIKTVNTYYDAASQEYDTRFDYNMPRVYSSTIVNNSAEKQGGGVWYNSDDVNVRFNSTVLWGNQCPDQPNVSGVYNVTRNDGQTYKTTEFYPFNYCALQDINASGLGNIPLLTNNADGARFHDEKNDPTGADLNIVAKENTTATGFDVYNDFGHYGLTNNSILVGNGMPLKEWENILSDPARNYGLTTFDFMEKERDATATGSKRTNIDIGARAITIETIVKELMLRLFVADIKDTDINAINAMIYAGINPTGTDEEKELKRYYSQKGSSFAHPFISLQDALTYIYKMRGFVDGKTIDTSDDGFLKTYHANELPFEIIMGPGTYKPTVDLYDLHTDANGLTFLIPEGVSIIGGVKPNEAVDVDGNKTINTNDTKNFYGKRYESLLDNGDYSDNDRNPRKTNSTAYKDRKENKKYYIDQNKKDITTGSLTISDATSGVNYVIHHTGKDKITAARTLSDNNANSVVEPWEFEQQTILSGAVEGTTEYGAKHVVTIMANQAYSGALPTDQGKKFENKTTSDYGYMPHEQGQVIAFDGITITGGYAVDYRQNTVTDDHKIGFSNGGGIFIDTNNYWDYYNKQLDATTENPVPDSLKIAGYRHIQFNGSAGYRDVPVLINRCRLNNNHAGWGGAISTNTTLDVINSSFEQNRAVSGKATVDMKLPDVTTTEPTDSVTVNLEAVFPGAGGAIYGTYQVTGINTIFENNEAYDAKNSDQLQDFYTLTERMDAHLYKGGVNNATPRKLLGGSGGAVFMARKGHFHFLNCNFVRNAANAFPAIYTLNPNKWFANADDVSLKDYNQALNTVFWGNEVHDEVKNKYGTNKDLMFIIDKVVNYGHGNREGMFNASLLDGDAPKTMKQLDDDTSTGYMEQLWFCAYEDERGKTQVNNIDLRDMEFKPRIHVMKIIMDEIKALRTGGASIPANYTYQNCNISLATDNSVNEGPNFVNPSIKAGYKGYLQSADWSPARLNNLTDYGWGKILQKITPSGQDYKSEFVKDANGNYTTWGAYPTIRNLESNEKYLLTVPIGDQPYMYTTYTDDDGNVVPLYRISYDPNPTHDQTYVDVGVYEYHHTQLDYTTEGDEVDVIWVSALEKPDNGLPDGSAWSQPTSDLQRAIETLLSSRNGHRKEIRMMDGTHTPTYTIDNKLTFYIDTEYQNSKSMYEADESITEEDKNTYGKGVMSLTIKGGYSHELNGVRDVDGYPSIIRQQTRTDGNNDNHRWDHLFFIKDPTQRYGKREYDENNNDGNYKEDPDGDDTKKIINTIPIQFEGVTLINSQASVGTNGAVIHYADLDTMAVKTKNNVTTTYDEDKIITPTPVNITTKYVDEKTHDWDVLDNPAKIIINKTRIIGSGVHGQNGETNRNTASAVYIGNNGGHALLYNNVFHDNYGSPLVGKCEVRSLNNTFAQNGGLVDFSDAGAKGSYIHNSVLWRNNKTGTSGGSDVYDEQFLFNNPVTTDGKFDLTQNGAIFKRNAYTGGNTEATNYAVGQTIATNNYNVGLYDDNEDIIHSPRFIDPFAATEDKDFGLYPSLRLMHKGDDALYLTPVTAEVSHTFKDDKGNTLQKYDNSGDSTRMMQKFTNENSLVIYDLAYEPSYNFDAAHNKRIVTTIDLGAYEYQHTMNRVLYVDPNRTNDESTNGKTWPTAYGLGSLQSAIDMAALYNINNPDKQAFVFVKGSMDRHTGEPITLRNGVSIYGGIHHLFTGECAYSESGAGTEWVYNDTDLQTYVQNVENENEGHIGPNTVPTNVTAIKTNANTAFNIDGNTNVYTLVDGIHVTATTTANTAGKVTEPVINVNPSYTPNAGDATKRPKVVLRNIVVHDNDISGATQADNRPANIAYMKNALIYSALFRNNKVTISPDADAGVTLLLDDNAWAVSITAEGETATKTVNVDADGNPIYSTPYLGWNAMSTPIEGYDYDQGEASNRILNSIVNFRYDSNDTEEVKAIKDETRKTLTGWNYRRESSGDRNMYYQLVEGSKHINEIKISTTDADKKYLPTEMGFVRKFVNYKADRDLLGNPRLLTLTDTEPNGTALTANTALLDRGAFETWYVNKDTKTDETNHFAPHTGSVVYIMEGKSLTCGTDFRPGFLLIKDGASLYGNGHNVDVAFVSVERMIRPTGSVVSMPFPMVYAPQTAHTDNDDGTMKLGTNFGYCIPKYGGSSTAKQGILSLDCTDYNETAEVSTYNGEGRSDFKYVFAASGSKMWESYDNVKDTIPANTGVLFKPKGIKGDSIYAFTAQATSMTDYIYVEEPDEPYKEVVLTQYDDSKSTNGGGDFTSKENMGWNCIGMPYLVSTYETHKKDYAQAALRILKNDNDYTNTEIYNMQTPKTLWLYYNKQDAGNQLTPDDKTGNVDGDGGYYSVKSWDITDKWHLPEDFGTPRIWVGEGIFTQTSTMDSVETLTFYRPIAPTINTAKEHDGMLTAPCRNTRYYAGEEAIEDRMELDINIRVRQRTVTISGLKGGENIAIYDTTGRLYVRGTASTAPEDSVIGTQYSTTLSAGGVYIIAVDGTRKKVAVK